MYHGRAILSQYFCYLYIYRFTCLNVFKFQWMSIFSQRNMSMEYHNVQTMLRPCIDHIEATFCYFYYIFGSICQKWLKFSLDLSLRDTKIFHPDVWFWPYGGQVWTTLRPLFCILAYWTSDIFDSTLQKMFQYSLTLYLSDELRTSEKNTAHVF